MNRSLCPDGYATDELFIFASHPTCDVSIAVFVSFMTLLLLLRLVINRKEYQFWMRREELVSRQKHKYLFNRRVPLVPLLGSFQAVCLLLFTILSALNITNVYNGGTSVLMAFFFSPVLIGAIHMARRLTILKQKLVKPMPGIPLNSNEDFDLVIKFLLFLSFLGFLIIGVSALILAPAWISPIPFIIFSAGGALFDFSTLFVTMYQYQGCIDVVKHHMDSVQNRSNGEAKYRQALYRFRSNQIIVIVFMGSAAVLWVLMAVSVVPLHWYIFYIHFCIDVFGRGLSLATFRKEKKNNATSAESPPQLAMVLPAAKESSRS